ncbi:hypothetical protein BC628DRAFT_1367544 [Trametes gibbosa]|nr:hypothetical protein BC628DRAFT_1367544 [Trametes gibbosa]
MDARPTLRSKGYPQPGFLPLTPGNPRGGSKRSELFEAHVRCMIDPWALYVECLPVRMACPLLSESPTQRRHCRSLDPRSLSCLTFSVFRHPRSEDWSRILQVPVGCERATLMWIGIHIPCDTVLYYSLLVRQWCFPDGGVVHPRNYTDH